MKTLARNSDFLNDEDRYRQWRRNKLNFYPGSVEEILVPIDGLASVTPQQITAIKSTCRRSNMAIYQCRDPSVNRTAVVAFAAQFGLRRLDHHLCANEDGVAELSVASEGVRSEYVPYSNRSLSWHTDGYYNDSERQIRAVILHCAQSAVAGGENALLDPDLVYIRLRDENPHYITALEHPECMTIPANNNAGDKVRPALSGPVFAYGAAGEIHMRYSARKKNIHWRDDPLTTQARDFLADILDATNGPVFRYRLEAGEGLLSNNILHDRTGFSDDRQRRRLLYRARFFDRIEI